MFKFYQKFTKQNNKMKLLVIVICAILMVSAVPDDQIWKEFKVSKNCRLYGNKRYFDCGIIKMHLIIV